MSIKYNINDQEKFKNGQTNNRLHFSTKGSSINSTTITPTTTTTNNTNVAPVKKDKNNQAQKYNFTYDLSIDLRPSMSSILSISLESLSYSKDFDVDCNEISDGSMKMLLC